MRSNALCPGEPAGARDPVLLPAQDDDDGPRDRGHGDAGAGRRVHHRGRREPRHRTRSEYCGHLVRIYFYQIASIAFCSCFREVVQYDSERFLCVLCALRLFVGFLRTFPDSVLGGWSELRRVWKLAGERRAGHGDQVLHAPTLGRRVTESARAHSYTF